MNTNEFREGWVVSVVGQLTWNYPIMSNFINIFGISYNMDQVPKQY